MSGFEGPPRFKINSPERSPDHKMEMVAAKCPQCAGKGRTKDTAGKEKSCGRCNGTGQIRTR